MQGGQEMHFQPQGVHEGGHGRGEGGSHGADGTGRGRRYQIANEIVVAGMHVCDTC